MTRRVIGVDEVGRGCLAGPVVCAAVVLPEFHRPWVDEVKDSKKLSPKKRQELAEYIIRECVYSIREGAVHQIDEINILQTTLVVMKQCVDAVQAQLGPKAAQSIVLVDGNRRIPGLHLPQEAIKGGDNLHKAIGAASIIAKVYRDNYMIAIDRTYPEYGFVRHKGYGTAEHREAIMMHGPCILHRKTFRGVYEYVKSSEVS